MLTRLLAAVVLLLASGVVGAQTAPDTTKRPWSVGGRVRLAMERDDNVFRLSEAQLIDLVEPTASQLQSGRYARMTSGGDNILITRFEGVIEGPGLTGRPVRLLPAIIVERYAVNAERSNVALALEVEQDLRRGRQLQLHADFVPRYFHRNYLADAVDLNADRSIQGAERVYGRGDYREFELRADYQHRLRDSKRNQPLRVYGVVGLGWSDRAYDAPFRARNHGGPTARTRLRVEPRRTITLVATYDVALLSSPVRDQVVLIDEMLLGEDLNGNATTTDVNVRVVSPVDRSRTEHQLEQRATVVVSDRLEVTGLVSYRWREFSSQERLDIANRDRSDRRLEYGATAEYRLRRTLRLFGGASVDEQRLSQLEDLGGEGTVDDYRRTRVHLGVRISR
jgi:hypothetical protein